jgi:hypothetical protein
MEAQNFSILREEEFSHAFIKKFWKKFVIIKVLNCWKRRSFRTISDPLFQKQIFFCWKIFFFGGPKGRRPRPPKKKIPTKKLSFFGYMMSEIVLKLFLLQAI